MKLSVLNTFLIVLNCLIYGAIGERLTWEYMVKRSQEIQMLDASVDSFIEENALGDGGGDAENNNDGQ